MTTLYESVEDLDEQFLQTKACKNMLLHPQNAYDEKLQELLVTVEDTEISYYLCPKWDDGENHGMSTVRNTLYCICGQEMNQKITNRKKNVARDVEDGVFVKGFLSYLITDDLLVLPASTMAFLALLKRHGISDKTWLEKRNVKVGRKEVLRLFKRLLLSKTLLTDAFLRKDDSVNVLDNNPKDLIKCKSESYTGDNPKKINLRFILMKSTGRVLFAEAGEGFIDFLFSFLTFPLGSICNFLGGCTNLGSLDNLYQSLQDNNICPKDSWEKSELLYPKIQQHFDCTNQLLPIRVNSCLVSLTKCWICSRFRSNCIMGYHNCSHEDTAEHVDYQKFPCDPKYFKLTGNFAEPCLIEDEGRTFMKGPATFMVTDNLKLGLFSPMDVIYHLDGSKLEERIVSVGKEEAVDLLRAALISKTALSDAFCTMKGKHNVKIET